MAKYVLLKIIEDQPRSGAEYLLALIVLVVFALSQITDCVSEKYHYYQNKKTVIKTVQDVNSLKYSIDKITLEQCQIYLTSDVVCDIDDNSKVIESHKGFPCSKEFLSTLSETILKHCYRLINKECFTDKTYPNKTNCKYPLWAPYMTETHPHEDFPYVFYWSDIHCLYDENYNLCGTYKLNNAKRRRAYHAK